VSLARLVITAVVLEGRRPIDVATEYGVSKGWVSKLVARYHAEGDSAFEPRSRRPHTSPSATPPAVVALIIATRHDLTRQGLDAGTATIAWHLDQHRQVTVSESTIHRYLVAAGLVTPEPRKKPRASYIRFQAELPNECWQADFTHHRLATGEDTEILTWLDDHSRCALSITAHIRVTGPIVIDTFTHTTVEQGIPYSTLTDNGMVFTTRLSGGGGRNGYENLLVRLGVIQKNSRPNHPTTCGKVERFQQTMKKWLRAQADQPATINELQQLLDTFRHDYNHRRPHRSLPHRSTPAAAYQARPKATPTGRDDIHYRIRHDRVSSGRVSLRVNGNMHHIGLGRPLDGTRVILLIADLDIRVIHADTGEIIRTLTLDPTKRYHGTGRPPGGPTGPRNTRRTTT
jgi:transposase InsO family protein